MDVLGNWTLDSVVNTDALSLLRGLPDGSVDAVVTSPPYNLRNTTGGEMRAKTGKWSMGALAKGYGDYDDNLPNEEYVAWQRRVMGEMFRVIKDTGAIFYNHKWRVQNGVLQRLADAITDGFPVRQIVIWQRAGGINFNDSYFVPTYEVIYVVAKPNFRLRAGANGYGDAWYIPQESGTPHPAPFPYELPRRILDSIDADIVVDPFCGWGTALLAARNMGRRFIGCDISAEYVALANKRLALPYTLPMFAEVQP